MKNLFNAGFVVLLLVVLGCNCQKFRELADESRNDPPTVSNTSTVPTNTTTTKTNSGAAISMDKYNQIKTNMKKSEVEAIIGGAGEEISSSSGGGYTFSSYKWTGENYSTIIVIFQNDKVSSKSQFGLK